jgi:hypothetical protein
MVVLAFLALKFIGHEPHSAPTYSPAQSKAIVLRDVFVVIGEETSSVNDLPIPGARSAATLRRDFRSDDYRVHVSVRGSNIMVISPNEPAVCVWVPEIVNGPKSPALASHRRRTSTTCASISSIG